VSSYNLQIETSVVSHLLELVGEEDRNKDGKIDFDEWEAMGKQAITILVQLTAHHVRPVKRIKKKIPMAATHLEKVCSGSSNYLAAYNSVLGPGLV
jgi:hypothetical protein